MSSIIDFLGSAVFWAAIGSFGTIVSLVAVYYQIRQSRLVVAADFLMKLDKQFQSKTMKKSRKELVDIVERNREDFNTIENHREVPDFFENVGLLVSKNVVPVELVWSTFCYWILPYWSLLEKYVSWCRGTDKDPYHYSEFQRLYENVLRFEQKKRCRIIDVKTLEDDLIKDEKSLPD